jgi:hypothetical protein
MWPFKKRPKLPENYAVKEYVETNGDICFALVHWLNGHDGTWWPGNYHIEAKSPDRSVIEKAVAFKNAELASNSARETDVRKKGDETC